jgi:TRAP-type C4-dicarboxylate transport system permease small subunit
VDKTQAPGGRLSRIFDRILLGTSYASGTIIVIMMLSMSYEVVMRYYFKAPTRWAGDFSGYMQYALVLIAAAWVLSIRGHTRIDILVSRLTARWQQVLGLITSAVALIACLLFVWVGIEATQTAYAGNEFLYRDIELPLYPFYAVIPFSFILLAIQFGRIVYNHWRVLRTDTTEGQGKAG